jgi:hypothetical protein
MRPLGRIFEMTEKLTKANVQVVQGRYMKTTRFHQDIVDRAPLLVFWEIF